MPTAGRWAPPKIGSASKIPSASVFPIISGTWWNVPFLNSVSGSSGNIGSRDNEPSIAPVIKKSK